MRDIYQYTDYKEYFKEVIQKKPKAGRGQYLKLSQYLNVHSTLISQVLGGQKDFSSEQAIKVAKYFALNAQETEYFFTMLNLNKAGSAELREYYKFRLTQQPF